MAKGDHGGGKDWSGPEASWVHPDGGAQLTRRM